jgi:hypothetical protein
VYFPSVVDVLSALVSILHLITLINININIKKKIIIIMTVGLLTRFEYLETLLKNPSLYRYVVAC